MEPSDERVKKLEELGWRFRNDPKQGWIVHDPDGEEFPNPQGSAWPHLIYAIEAAEEAEKRSKR